VNFRTGWVREIVTRVARWLVGGGSGWSVKGCTWVMQKREPFRQEKFASLGTTVLSFTFFPPAAAQPPAAVVAG
jgi:hypothetical protein